MHMAGTHSADNDGDESFLTKKRCGGVLLCCFWHSPHPVPYWEPVRGPWDFLVVANRQVSRTIHRLLEGAGTQQKPLAKKEFLCLFSSLKKTAFPQPTGNWSGYRQKGTGSRGYLLIPLEEYDQLFCKPEIALRSMTTRPLLSLTPKPSTLDSTPSQSERSTS